MNAEPLLTDVALAEARRLRAEGEASLAIEGFALDAEQAALFDGFEADRLPHAERRARIAARAAEAAARFPAPQIPLLQRLGLKRAPPKSPYWLPGTTILLNLPGLSDPAALARAEAETVLQAECEGLVLPQMTAEAYRSLHRQLFGRIYPFAGEYRTERTMKRGHAAYPEPDLIAPEMDRIFANLNDEDRLKRLEPEAFALRAAEYMRELDAIHPFREGNSRTLRAFLALLARGAGHVLDRRRIAPGPWREARQAAMRMDCLPMARLLRSAITGACATAADAPATARDTRTLAEKLAALPRTGRLVFMTGAGISRESGIATYRDEDGTWRKINVNEVATAHAFATAPDRVLAFHNEHRQIMASDAVRPNAAHLALAALERSWPGEVVVITQNMDTLHEQAGQRKVLHMHGQFDRALCMQCGSRCDWPRDMDTTTVCPACGKAGGMRPDVVWFQEKPYHLDEIEKLLASCDLYCAIGTSGEVWPAAGYVNDAARKGAMTLEVNPQITARSIYFDERLSGPASEAVPQLVRMLGAAL